MPDRRIDRSQPRKNRVDLSVVIKSFNEEAHIEECLRSIFAGCAELSFEVILADARSTDRTVEIAKRFPITVVQLAHDRNVRIQCARRYQVLTRAVVDGSVVETVWGERVRCSQEQVNGLAGLIGLGGLVALHPILRHCLHDTVQLHRRLHPL